LICAGKNRSVRGGGGPVRRKIDLCGQIPASAGETRPVRTMIGPVRQKSHWCGPKPIGAMKIRPVRPEFDLCGRKPLKTR